MSQKDKLIERLLRTPKDFPHPNGILKRYVLDQIIEKLRKDDLL